MDIRVNLLAYIQVMDLRMFSRSPRNFVLVLALLSTAGCLHTGGTSPLAVEDGSLGSLSKTGISMNVHPGVSMNMVLITPSDPHAALVISIT